MAEIRLQNTELHFSRKMWREQSQWSIAIGGTASGVDCWH